MADIPITNIDGRGVLPVDAFMAFNAVGDIKIDSNGSIWLSSGVVDTDVASYPQATQKDISFYNGFNADISATITDPSAICCDGTYYWIGDQSTLRVYRFTKSGVYDGFNFDVSARVATISDMAYDGTNIVVQASAASAFIYEVNGSYTGTLIASNASTAGNVSGVTFYNDQYYFADNNSNDLARFDASGAYVDSLPFLNSPNNSHAKIAADDDGRIWSLPTIGTSAWRSFLSDQNFDYDNVVAVKDASMSIFKGMDVDGDQIVFVTNTSIIRHTISPAVGIKDAYVDDITGFPIFVRVK